MDLTNVPSGTPASVVQTLKITCLLQTLFWPETNCLFHAHDCREAGKRTTIYFSCGRNAETTTNTNF